MGQVTVDPKTLLYYIYGGGWFCEKGHANFTIYDGTRNGLFSSKFIEQALVGTLMFYKFIIVDGGNWDFHETFYVFNPDYEHKNNKELLYVLKEQIKNYNYKNKYKHLIRQHKLERVLK